MILYIFKLVFLQKIHILQSILRGTRTNIWETALRYKWNLWEFLKCGQPCVYTHNAWVMIKFKCAIYSVENEVDGETVHLGLTDSMLNHLFKGSFKKQAKFLQIVRQMQEPGHGEACPTQSNTQPNMGRGCPVTATHSTGSPRSPTFLPPCYTPPTPSTHTQHFNVINGK